MADTHRRAYEICFGQARGCRASRWCCEARKSATCKVMREVIVASLVCTRARRTRVGAPLQPPCSATYFISTHY